MKKKNAYRSFFAESKKHLPAKLVKQAEKEAEGIIRELRLSELRQQIGVRQSDVKGFSQSAISRLESRKDIRINTLIAYLRSLGMGVEIRARRKKGSKEEDFVLLRA